MTSREQKLARERIPADGVDQMPATFTNGLSADEVRILRAARNCTDMAGLPIMSDEAATVVALEKLGLIRIIGEHQNRVGIERLGRDALASIEAMEA